MTEPTPREYWKALIDHERELREKCVNSLERRLSESSKLLWMNHQIAHREHADAHTSEHGSTEKAVGKAETNASERVHALAVSQEKRFEDFDKKFDLLRLEIADIKLAQRGTVGRDQGVGLAWSVAVVLVSVVITIGIFLLSRWGL